MNRAICLVCGVPEGWLSTQARLDEDTEILIKAHENFRRILIAAVSMIANPIRSSVLSERISRSLFSVPELKIAEESAKMDVTLVEDFFANINLLDYMSAEEYMRLMEKFVNMHKEKQHPA